MNKVLLRAISGSVYVALIVCALIFGQPWLTALLSLFALAAFIEFQQANFHHNSAVTPAIRVIDILFGVSLVAASGFGLFYTLIATVTVVLCWPIVRFTLALYDNNSEAFASTAMSGLSLLYIAVPLSVLNVLYDITKPASHLVLMMFILIWLNDTGAYCVGSMCGKRRLFERLSPKKSWEGFFGGLGFCLAAGALYALFWHGAPLSWVEGLVFGAVVSVFSTWGDLFESLMKRNSGVKDSGNIIPGHGGILDRIDSLLFVAPATMIFWLIITW